jgi:hypothetical protein
MGSRCGAGFAPFPSQNQSRRLIVTGGYLDPNTAEVLTEKGWEIFPLAAPTKLEFGYCKLTVNSTTLMIIGGGQKTYYFNTERNVWTEGPVLNVDRYYHSCARVKKDINSLDMSVIVAGGLSYEVTGMPLTSVEILDPGSNTWRFGPELPNALEFFPMIEKPDGGVVILGGYLNGFKNSMKILTLIHAGYDWQLTNYLKKERGESIAFLVPDEYCWYVLKRGKTTLIGNHFYLDCSKYKKIGFVSKISKLCDCIRKLLFLEKYCINLVNSVQINLEMF